MQQYEILTNFELDLSNPDRIKELESRLSLSSAKRILKEKMGFQVEAKDFDSLMRKIREASISINENQAFLSNIVSQDLDALKSSWKFKALKKYLAQKIPLKIQARGWDSLKDKLQILLSTFSSKPEASKYEIYEKIKRSNFVGNSRLEGITVSESPQSKKMADILSKYRNL